jgi:hypothetical protein
MWGFGYMGIWGFWYMGIWGFWYMGMGIWVHGYMDIEYMDI